MDRYGGRDSVEAGLQPGSPKKGLAGLKPRAYKIKSGLEGVAGFGGMEVLDAVAEEGLFGEGLDEDDLGGDEDGLLSLGERDGDFDEGLGVILPGAFEAQAALGHVLASDDVVAAFGMADAGGVADLDARMLAAIDTSSSGGGRSLRSGGGAIRGSRRDGKDGGGRLPESVASNIGRGNYGAGDELRGVSGIGGTRAGEIGRRGGSGWREAGLLRVERRLRSGRRGRREECGIRRGIVIGRRRESRRSGRS